jgi:hypothetical protein
MQLESDQTLIYIGSRVVELEGLPSQRCGVVITFRSSLSHPGFPPFPVVCWDDGSTSFSSSDLGLRRLADVEQLSLF